MSFSTDVSCPLTVTQRYQERFGRTGFGGRRRFVGDPSAAVSTAFARDSSAAADGASVFARVTAHDDDYGDRGRPRSASPAVALPAPPPLPSRRRRRAGPHSNNSGVCVPRRPRVVCGRHGPGNNCVQRTRCRETTFQSVPTIRPPPVACRGRNVDVRQPPSRKYGLRGFIAVQTTTERIGIFRLTDVNDAGRGRVAAERQI